jgi:hypothetical protein
MYVLAWLFIFIWCGLPPILVENASPYSRKMWAVYWVIFAIPIFFVSLIRLAGRDKGRSLTFREPHYRVFAVSVFVAFSFTVFASIGIVNITDTSASISSLLANISGYTEVAFPVVKKYGEYARRHGQELQGLKLQAVTSLWLVLWILTISNFFFQYYSMLPDDRKRFRQWQQSNEGNRSSGGKAFFSGLFGIPMALSAYFGWGIFDSGYTAKSCLFHVSCFIGNDLAVIAAAALISVGIFGFGLGSILMIHRALSDWGFNEL